MVQSEIINTLIENVDLMMFGVFGLGIRLSSIDLPDDMMWQTVAKVTLYSIFESISWCLVMISAVMAFDLIFELDLRLFVLPASFLGALLAGSLTKGVMVFISDPLKYLRSAREVAKNDP